MANPYFNATYYLTNNPDVFAAGINTEEGAWEHYVNHGAAESLAGATSRKPAPWFDATYYLTNNPDLSIAGLTAGQLFEHFTVHGISEGRAPSSSAVLTEESLLKYALANEDLLEAFDIADDATELTDAQALALASQFYSHGYMESRPDAPFEADVDPGNPGATFTLTTGVDNIEGTAGDDTVSGVLGAGGTWTVGDQIDGGAGDDTFNLTVATSGTAIPAGAEVRNVEVVNVRLADSAAGTTALNSAVFAGVREIWQIDNDGTNNNFGDVTVGDDVTVGYRSAGAAGASGTVTAAAGVEAVSIALDGTVGGSIIVGESAANDVSEISVSGSAVNGSNFTLNATALDVDTLNLAISSNTPVVLGAGLADDLVTINGSGSTGNLTLNLTTNSVGASLESLIGGSGNDTITIDNADLDQAAVSIDLGAGADNLSFDLTSSGAATASAVTIAGGAGADIFTFDAAGNVANLAAVATNADVLANLVTIADFSAGEDAVDVSGLLVGAGARVAQNVVNAAVTAADPTNLLEAATAAFNTAQGGGNGDLVVFAYGGNTYVGVDTDANGALSDDDALIELTGISVSDLTAANFIA